jgi:hypothetical protein
MTSIALGACTINEDVRPTDMSAAGHERVARADDTAALEQERLYNPNADADRQHCAPPIRNIDDVASLPCWTRTTNSTEYHLREAARFRSAARAHRTAAKTLRDAETIACSGIADEDKDISPFAHREDILSTLITTEGERVTGVSILVRGVPGMTGDYLARLVDCHLARNAAMGFAMREMAFDPLNVKGAKASIEAFGGDFRVTLKADDEAAAREIAARATRLIGRPDASSPTYK